MVNGKVPLRGVVYFTHFTSSGQRETTNSLKMVGITKDPFMPLGVMEFGEEDVHFEAMEFISFVARALSHKTPIFFMIPLLVPEISAWAIFVTVQENEDKECKNGAF